MVPYRGTLRSTRLFHENGSRALSNNIIMKKMVWRYVFGDSEDLNLTYFRDIRQAVESRVTSGYGHEIKSVLYY